MGAPASENDGMGCLVTGGTARFRVWTPSAFQVQLEGDFTNWGANPIAMGIAGAYSTGTKNSVGIGYSGSRS